MGIIKSPYGRSPYTSHIDKFLKKVELKRMKSTYHCIHEIIVSGWWTNLCSLSALWFQNRKWSSFMAIVKTVILVIHCIYKGHNSKLVPTYPNKWHEFHLSWVMRIICQFIHGFWEEVIVVPHWLFCFERKLVVLHRLFCFERKLVVPHWLFYIQVNQMRQKHYKCTNPMLMKPKEYSVNTTTSCSKVNCGVHSFCCWLSNFHFYNLLLLIILVCQLQYNI